jgi:hypothetical protein
MSTWQRWRSYPLTERLAYYLLRMRAWRRRATRLGLAVRVVVWASGFAAMLLAMPAMVPVATGLPVVAALMLLPAARPRGRWVSIVAVAAIGLLAVRLAATTPAQPVLLAGAVGGLLYLHHSTAALAAQVRTDVVIPPAALRHWAARVGLVLAASAGLGLIVVVLPAPVWPATGQVALGVAAAVAVAAAVIGLVPRPRPDPSRR